MIHVWRLVSKRYHHAAFSGKGAKTYGGRWNSKGNAVVYGAQSIALGAMELLVHLRNNEELLREFMTVSIELFERDILAIGIDDLPGDWQKIKKLTQQIGDQWLQEMASLSLQVPSVIVPKENNYLINPQHPQFSELKIGDFEDFNFDPRLFQ